MIIAGVSPYPDETSYSIQARLRVRLAIKSPKALMENIYGDRAIAASWALPSHLQLLLGETLNAEGMTAARFVCEHTLFPLIAPFIPTQRRHTVMQSMIAGSGAGIHVMSGFAASRIPKSSHLRFCANCAQEQYVRFGEPYFVRRHQIPAVINCYKHNVALEVITSVKKGAHRHEFVPLTLKNVSSTKAVEVSKYDKIISHACEALLNSKNVPSPSYSQWTNYYRLLARKHGLSKGAYVDYEPIKDKIERFWPSHWLEHAGLTLHPTQSSWLHAIFRKHRKSFSYLEHIFVNAAFLQDKFDIIKCVEYAAKQPNSVRQRDSVSSIATASPHTLISANKIAWKELLKTQTPMLARNKTPALYSTLYRCDRNWLLAINEQHKLKREPVKSRINWRRRDFAAVKSLFAIIPKIEDDLSLPRSTKRWLMFQLSNTFIVEKFARKLPLTSLFLTRYSESIAEYQIRRITHQLVTNRHPYITRRWYLLRASGLSEVRMTNITRQFLTELSEFLPAFGYPTLGFETNTT